MAVVALLCAQPGEPKRMGIVTAQIGFTIPVSDRDGREYVGVLDVLEPMGPVSLRPDGRKWKVSFGAVEAEFTEGGDEARVNRKKVKLGAKALVENGRPLVPVPAVPAIVEAATGIRPEWHAQARRLLVGAEAVRVQAVLQKGTQATLALNFSAPVNPQVHTEPGGVRLVFTREALAVAEMPRVQDPVLSGVTVIERNGAVEMIVSGVRPLMARFSDANRTITVGAAPAPPAPAPPAPVQAGPATVAPPPAAKPARVPFFVLIDPAHGGEDGGATLSANLAEKNVVLAMAHRLRQDLEARGIPARLLRDGDTALPSGERAVAANRQGAAVVISLHATTSGAGVHLATSALPPASSRAAVLPWKTAQATFIPAARTIAGAIASELLKRDVPATLLNAAVPPLDRLAAPAVAIEIAPAPGKTSAEINANLYLQSISNAIAAGVAAQRVQLQEARR